MVGELALLALDHDSSEAADFAAQCTGALRVRACDGDQELADAIDAARGIAVSDADPLKDLAVDLEQLADLIDGGPESAGGRLDLTTGEVWPEFAFTPFPSSCSTLLSISLQHSSLITHLNHYQHPAHRPSFIIRIDITSSMCWPHPRQVVFPQRAQRAGEHMLFSFDMGECRSSGKGRSGPYFAWSFRSRQWLRCGLAQQGDACLSLDYSV